MFLAGGGVFFLGGGGGGPCMSPMILSMVMITSQNSTLQATN